MINHSILWGGFSYGVTTPQYLKSKGAVSVVEIISFTVTPTHKKNIIPMSGHRVRELEKRTGINLFQFEAGSYLIFPSRSLERLPNMDEKYEERIKRLSESHLDQVRIRLLTGNKGDYIYIELMVGML